MGIAEPHRSKKCEKQFPTSNESCSSLFLMKHKSKNNENTNKKNVDEKLIFDDAASVPRNPKSLRSVNHRALPHQEGISWCRFVARTSPSCQTIETEKISRTIFVTETTWSESRNRARSNSESVRVLQYILRNFALKIIRSLQWKKHKSTIFTTDTFASLDLKTWQQAFSLTYEHRRISQIWLISKLLKIMCNFPD